MCTNSHSTVRQSVNIFLHRSLSCRLFVIAYALTTYRKGTNLVHISLCTALSRRIRRNRIKRARNGSAWSTVVTYRWRACFCRRVPLPSQHPSSWQLVVGGWRHRKSIRKARHVVISAAVRGVTGRQHELFRPKQTWSTYVVARRRQSLSWHKHTTVVNKF